MRELAARLAQTTQELTEAKSACASFAAARNRLSHRALAFQLRRPPRRSGPARDGLCNG
jgi:hypothetical protein